jgi:hypothetical protein
MNVPFTLSKYHVEGWAKKALDMRGDDQRQFTLSFSSDAPEDVLKMCSEDE